MKIASDRTHKLFRGELRIIDIEHTPLLLFPEEIGKVAAGSTGTVGEECLRQLGKMRCLRDHGAIKGESIRRQQNVQVSDAHGDKRFSNVACVKPWPKSGENSI